LFPPIINTIPNTVTPKRKYKLTNKSAINVWQKGADFQQFFKDKKHWQEQITEIQSGAVAKSYVRKGFLKYVEMRKYFPIYEEAVSHI
jgi:hypothetical protein